MTQRDWQKDMDRVNIFEHAKTLCNNPFPPSIEHEPTEVALGYWLQEAKRLEGIATGRGQAIIRKNAEIAELEARADAAERREQRLKEALEKIKLLAEQDYIRHQTDRMYLVPKDILATLYPDTPAPKEGE